MAKQFGRAEIEARLGRSQSSRGTAPPASASGGRNTLYASAFGVLVAGAAGIFIASGGGGVGGLSLENLFGPPAETYKSRVADVCEPGWREDRMNRDQIHCYLTRQVTRLCNPQERRALAEKLRAYQLASDRWMGNLTVASLQLMGKPGVMSMGLAEAKIHDPNLTDEERAEQFNKVSGMAHDFLSPTDKILQASTNTVTRPELVADVKDVVGQGYLAAEDLLDPVPKWAKEGLAAAGHVAHSPCR